MARGSGPARRLVCDLQQDPLSPDRALPLGILQALLQPRQGVGQELHFDPFPVELLRQADGGAQVHVDLLVVRGRRLLLPGTLDKAEQGGLRASWVMAEGASTIMSVAEGKQQRMG